MNFLFAWRYFKAKKSTNAINIIAWVSMAAIVVGAASLILVLSVFNGFEDLVKSLYTSFYPDIKITPATGKTLTLTPQQLQQLAGIKGVRALSLEAQDNAVLQNGDWRAIAYLKGVDENFSKVTGVKEKLVRGKFELGTEDHPLAVLGSGIGVNRGRAPNTGQGFTEVGQRQLPLRPQARDLPADGFFDPHPSLPSVTPSNDNVAL